MPHTLSPCRGWRQGSRLLADAVSVSLACYKDRSVCPGSTNARPRAPRLQRLSVMLKGPNAATCHGASPSAVP
jgi:hypothetical protein